MRPGMTFSRPAESLHDSSRRTVLSARRPLGRSDRSRHAAGFVVDGGVRIWRAARDRVSRPADQLQGAGRPGRDRSRRFFTRRLRQEYFGRAVPRQYAGPSRQFLRRAEGRRPHRASVAARRRDRAVAQALRFRRARAGHQQPRNAVADRAEISRQGPARPPDRLRGRRLGQGRHTANGAARQSRCYHLQAIHRRRGKAGAMAADVAPTMSRCCNIPAAPPACRRARC